ncbi:3-methyl-2-oxobutanoate hydroxymethyltransferase [Leptolyngbya cf. ectocarpi LEGE 11479]|uniref:3-methyl-2-oxobutanoate hydroxymethyltransferase n=1 Tax=Leptolyngbya cf. ectocarpi LEGE 11479 TaxID=1828722 RepID=A0A928ZV85_LEPEC|nr:3-methyl-2-oxobutanoate hydroxymethyltransferase [Leptolyngbya ectocarpi]MBE9068095.1 3-methyl-2-oxobutanoate hydroxymethyltransferase [Leptolyngbya cf. ectocarpi LEGE 11479]
MTITVSQIAGWKQAGRPIAVLTAWDFLSAQIVDAAGIDIALVGDSLAMTVLGYDTTVPLTLDEVLHHAKAVRRGVSEAMMVVDLPFLSYQISPEQALTNAGRVMKETEAQAVKLEGGHPTMAATVHRLTQSGIPVMGHVGLTPQAVHQFGGFRKQGKTAESAERILQEAQALEAAGAFAIVLEHIPPELAQTITNALAIATIGIGAGPHCDGQVLVTSDLWGLSAWQPPFAKPIVDLRSQAIQAVQQFCDQVRQTG